MRSETVDVTGTRTATGPLTWGQQSIWRITQWLEEGDPYFNVPWMLPVYGKPGLPEVLDALGRLVARHESLRTTCADEGHGLVQRVAAVGTLAVGVVETVAANPRAAAKELAADLAAKGFDYAAEPPLRCVVVMRDGRPRALAMALSHLAVDGWALDLLAAEWRELLAGRELPEPRWQPLDQAAFEQGQEGAARGARALRYWRSALEQAPRSLFDFTPAEPEEPRYVKVAMESSAVAAAAEILAERWAVSTTSVLVAAGAALLGAVTGHRDLAMQFIVANRHEPRMAAMVGTAVQDGLFVLRLPEGSFADAARAAHARALVAYRHAHYEPAAQRALREEGTWVDLSAYFNDSRSIGGWPNRPRRDPADLTGRTTTSFVGAWPEVDAKFFLATGSATDTCQLSLLTDTAFLPRATSLATLLAIEGLLVDSVAADVPLSRIHEYVTRSTEEMT